MSFYQNHRKSLPQKKDPKGKHYTEKEGKKEASKATAGDIIKTLTNEVSNLSGKVTLLEKLHLEDELMIGRLQEEVTRNAQGNGVDISTQTNLGEVSDILI